MQTVDSRPGTDRKVCAVLLGQKKKPVQVY
jgi:hypothetical protein